MQHKTHPIYGFILLLLAQLMVGICIVASKKLVTHLSPVNILLIRFIIATAILWTAYLIVGKNRFAALKQLHAKDWIFITIEALCAGALFNLLLLIGLKHTSASVAGVITSALPAIVAIASIIFLKERISTRTLLCIIFAVLGLIVINAGGLSQFGGQSLLGELIIFLSLFPEATYYILSKMHKNKLHVFLVSAIMNSINIPCLLLFSLLRHQQLSFAVNIHQLALLLIVGIASALFYVFWFMGYDKVHGSAAGLSTAFMPISTLALAWLFLSETITTYQFIGMLLVILSIAINAGRRRPVTTTAT